MSAAEEETSERCKEVKGRDRVWSYLVVILLLRRIERLNRELTLLGVPVVREKQVLHREPA